MFPELLDSNNMWWIHLNDPIEFHSKLNMNWHELFETPYSVSCTPIKKQILMYVGFAGLESCKTCLATLLGTTSNIYIYIYINNRFFFPKDVSSQGFSEDCWRISHHTYPTHIQHITHNPHILTYPFKTYPTNTYPTNTYPFNTYPTSTYPFNAYPFKRFASVLHTYPFKTYPTNTYPTNTFSFNTYPTNTYPCDAYPFNAYPFKRCASAGIPNVSHQYISHQYISVQHVSHQYGSIQCVSIQKVCISRNGNEYEYHCMSFHTIATRREW